MSLPWSDDTGLRPLEVFTNCDIPKNLVGCIGFAADQIDESLTASLVSPDVLVQAMDDCSEYIFSDDLDEKISTMMTNCNQVFFIFYFRSESLFFRLYRICLLLKSRVLIICPVLFVSRKKISVPMPCCISARKLAFLILPIHLKD